MMHVAFYKAPGTLTDKLIRRWLRGPYSHCELVFELVDNGPSLCISSSPRDGGMRSKRIMLDSESWDIVPVDADINAAWAWAAEHAKESYDLLGLAGFIWRPESGEKNKWFCSEAVAAMLGYPQSWRFDPCALHAILNKKGNNG